MDHSFSKERLSFMLFIMQHTKHRIITGILFLTNAKHESKNPTWLLVVSMQHKLQVTFLQTLHLKNLKFTVIKIKRTRKKKSRYLHTGDESSNNLLVIILNCCFDKHRL